MSTQDAGNKRVEYTQSIKYHQITISYDRYNPPIHSQPSVLFSLSPLTHHLPRLSLLVPKQYNQKPMPRWIKNQVNIVFCSGTSVEKMSPQEGRGGM